MFLINYFAIGKELEEEFGTDPKYMLRDSFGIEHIGGDKYRVRVELIKDVTHDRAHEIMNAGRTNAEV